MSRYAFSSSWNNMPMSSVRQEITTVAMAKPLDSTTPIDAGSNAVYLVAIATNGTTYTMPSNTYVRTSGAASTSSLTIHGDLTVEGNANVTGTSGTFVELNTSTLKVGGSIYKPFQVGNTATNTNLLWIDTTTTVPILKYHNGSAWVSIGAVFG